MIKEVKCPICGKKMKLEQKNNLGTIYSCLCNSKCKNKTTIFIPNEPETKKTK